jgi:hypothetical protein
MTRVSRLAVLALGLVVCLATVASAADKLEGRWTATLTPDKATADAGEKAFSDSLVFHGDQFTSEACVPQGFGAVKFEQKSSDAGVSFTANPVSEKVGKAAWAGTASKGEIKGTLAITKKDGSTMKYTFAGHAVVMAPATPTPPKK